MTAPTPPEPALIADYVAAANLLKTAGYTVIPPEEPNELYRREREVTDFVHSELGSRWRRAADNSLDLDDGDLTFNIVVRSYRRAL